MDYKFYEQTTTIYTKCIICGEPVPLTLCESVGNVKKVCEDCKSAIMWLKEKLKEEKPAK